MGYFFKRLFDLCVTMVVLLVLSPIFVFVSIAVLLSIGWPVFFVQKRVGRGDSLFSLIKFRTMKKAKADFVSQEDDAARLTTVGKIIRSLSLDELPQLFNVGVNLINYSQKEKKWGSFHLKERYQHHYLIIFLLSYLDFPFWNGR